jgi:hypothetical protein
MTIVGFPAKPELQKRLDEINWDPNLGKPHGTVGDNGVREPYPAPYIDKTNPIHYKHLGVECIQMTEHMSFCLGNVVKYVYRCNLKGGVEDLRKAKWYLEREIARREKTASQDSDDYHGC